MKILLVVLHADASRGGAEGYTLTLFRQLLQAGHDARVAAATFEPAVPRDRRVPLRFDGLTRTGRYGRFLDSLDRHLDGGADDVVHAMLPVRRCDVYQPQAGLEAVEWRAVRLAQRVGNLRRRTFVGTERKLLSADGGPGHRLPVRPHARRGRRPFRPAGEVPDGLSQRRRNQVPADSRAAPRESAVCVFVGQDFRRKGLDVAIRAIARHPAATLRVVGGDDPRPFEALAASLGVGGRVAFVGATRDVSTQLEDADALLFPTRREPFGMVAVEAMLRGVPCVVSANAGVAEIVRDGVDGRVMAGEDPAAWAAAIDDVLRRRAALSAACGLRRDGLSYGQHLRTLLGLYDRIVADRPVRPG